VSIQFVFSFDMTELNPELTVKPVNKCHLWTLFAGGLYSEVVFQAGSTMHVVWSVYNTN